MINVITNKTAGNSICPGSRIKWMGFSTFTCNMTSNMIPQTYNSTYINILQWKCPKPFIQWLIILQLWQSRKLIAMDLKLIETFTAASKSNVYFCWLPWIFLLPISLKFAIWFINAVHVVSKTKYNTFCTGRGL